MSSTTGTMRPGTDSGNKNSDGVEDKHASQEIPDESINNKLRSYGNKLQAKKKHTINRKIETKEDRLNDKITTRGYRKRAPEVDTTISREDSISDEDDDEDYDTEKGRKMVSSVARVSRLVSKK